jgi:hypothetical protein
MSPEAQLELALKYLTLSALHHLAIVVVMVIFWIRRQAMERTVAVYLAAAFGTSAFAMLSNAGTRLWGALAALLAALWIVEVVRAEGRLSFRRAPKSRLVVMALLCGFGLAYPGYSGALPSFVFSPLGVTLPPTLLVSLAALNSAAPDTNRPLHWALAVSGVVVGVSGLLVEGPVHVPLLVASGYALPLLAGRAKVTEERSEVDGTSVSAVQDRIHKRRVLMSRPRRSSVRRLDMRGRKK